MVTCASATARLVLRLHHLRQSEIQNLGVPALGNENIGRLDVAMDDACSMRGIQRIRNLDGQISSSPVDLHRLAVDQMLQRHPVHKLHGDERLCPPVRRSS